MCPADFETIWRFPKNVYFTSVYPSVLLPQPPNAQGRPAQEEVGVSVGGIPKVKFCGCWAVRVCEKASGLEDSQIGRHRVARQRSQGRCEAYLGTGVIAETAGQARGFPITSPSFSKHLKVRVLPLSVPVNHI